MFTRYDKYSKTNMYQTYKDSFDINRSFTADELEFYEGQIGLLTTTFRNEFPIPSNEEINVYIDNEEDDATYDDREGFVGFIRMIFENTYTIVKILQKLSKVDVKDKTKLIIKEKKDDVKRIERETKQEHQQKLKEEKEADRERKRIAREENKAIEKRRAEEAKQEKQSKANQICVCACGKKYTYSNKSKHMTTAIHLERLDAIQMFKNGMIIDEDDV
jgi:hypothetical protein